MNHGGYLFSGVGLNHTFSPTRTQQSMRVAGVILAQPKFSGMKRLILFSVCNLGVFKAGCVWTICACCQVCVNVSSAPAVLMAGLWIVATAMVKHGQTGDVQQWTYPKEICVCACVCVFLGVFKVLFSLPALWFLRTGQRCELRVNARFCFFHPHRRALVGQALAPCCSSESRTLLSLSITDPTSLSKAEPPQSDGRA